MLLKNQHFLVELDSKDARWFVVGELRFQWSCILSLQVVFGAPLTGVKVDLSISVYISLRSECPTLVILLDFG